MTPKQRRNLIQAIEQADTFDDWIVEKDQGTYHCTIWDNKCHRHWVSGQSTLALAISLACKKALEGK